MRCIVLCTKIIFSLLLTKSITDFVEWLQEQERKDGLKTNSYSESLGKFILVKQTWMSLWYKVDPCLHNFACKLSKNINRLIWCTNWLLISCQWKIVSDQFQIYSWEQWLKTCYFHHSVLLFRGSSTERLFLIIQVINRVHHTVPVSCEIALIKRNELRCILSWFFSIVIPAV